MQRKASSNAHPTSRIRRFLLLAIFATPARMAVTQANPNPHFLQANGKKITLTLPAEFDVQLAAEGLHRVRFMAKAPDDRIFATDMYNRADNTRGQVIILRDRNPSTGQFAKVTTYLKGLRNPNNLAFYTDASGQAWLYLPLTDRLLRYRYRAGDSAPTGPPEVLATYPDYGLNYKYGGWHLTRTVAFGKVNGKDRMFVSVGSSCNACQETETVRATISVMDTDGRNSRVLMRGVRNAVGLYWTGTALLATNMGADHLGDRSPQDTLLSISAAEVTAVEAGGTPLDAGWPGCYFADGKPRRDTQYGAAAKCTALKMPVATFAAHSSPLGVVPWDGGALVALHGAGHPRIGSGYRLVTVDDKGAAHDFVTGFITGGPKPVVAGRPCGIFALDQDHWLVTDDLLGAIYLITRRPAPGHFK